MHYVDVIAFELSMKKVSILTVGSRGDVEPFIALAKELMTEGYEVQLVTHIDFMPLASRHGVKVAPIQLSSKAFTAPLMNPPETNHFTKVRIMRGLIEPLLQSILPEMWQAADGSDAIISSGTTLWGLDIAEKLQVPHILVALQPLFATEEFPHVLMSDLPAWNGLINKLSYIFVGYSYWQMIARAINDWRVDYLELPKKIDRIVDPAVWSNQLHLLAYSSLVVPQPSDWAGNVFTTSYWRLSSSAYQPTKQLNHFLESSHEKPIYIGFGSMLCEDMRHLASMVISALCQSGSRGIISFEERYLEGIHLPENIINVGSVPHDWLFPKLAGAIHHGGAGTTAAALIAGIPSVAITFLNSDQIFWGRRLYELGVGLPPIKKEDLSTNKLMKAIEGLTSRNLQMKATQLGHEIKQENGCERAVLLIDQHIAASESLGAATGG